MARPPLLVILDGLVPCSKRASAADDADVRRRLALAFPPGVPDPVIAVCVVQRHHANRLVADVLLFDGEPAKVEIRGDAADGDFMSIRWHAPDDAVPWGWDPKARSWRRYPNDTPDDEPDAFARMEEDDIREAAKAERRRLGSLKAAETRRQNRAASHSDA